MGPKQRKEKGPPNEWLDNLPPWAESGLPLSAGPLSGPAVAELAVPALPGRRAAAGAPVHVAALWRIPIRLG